MSTAAGAGDGDDAHPPAPASEPHGMRAFAARAADVLGGIPAVRTLVATLAVYDAAGGGLVAGGLAYSALIALVPGLLLVASAIGLFVTDPAVQDRIVDAIAVALPPLESVVRIALRSVADGAVPTSIVALLGLLWGSSRFYAALDYAFSRVFPGSHGRNEIVRTLRGVVVTVLFVTLPVVALIVGSVTSWVLDLAPAGVEIRGLGRTLWQVASPVGSFVLFACVVAAVYRFVPPAPVPVRAFLRPALVAGLALAGFTQLFTFIAPRIVGFAALYGTFVAIFALLAWLSIGFNVLLLGASWARVRALAIANPDAPAARDDEIDGRETPGG
jgi:membrane protein